MAPSSPRRKEPSSAAKRASTGPTALPGRNKRKTPPLPEASGATQPPAKRKPALFQRTWPPGDEVRILEALATYRREHGGDLPTPAELYPYLVDEATILVEPAVLESLLLSIEDSDAQVLDKKIRKARKQLSKAITESARSNNMEMPTVFLFTSSKLQPEKLRVENENNLLVDHLDKTDDVDICTKQRLARVEREVVGLRQAVIASQSQAKGIRCESAKSGLQLIVAENQTPANTLQKKIEAPNVLIHGKNVEVTSKYHCAVPHNGPPNKPKMQRVMLPPFNAFPGMPRKVVEKSSTPCRAAGEEAGGGGGVMGSQCVKRSSSKKSQVLKKQRPLPQGFFPPMANPNSIDQDPNYSSPYGAFFAQFAYKPDRRQDGNGPSLPNAADRPVRLPSRGHPSSGSSLLTAKETSKAARTIISNTKQPCPASASTSDSQEGVRVKGKKPEKKMTREKKPRKPSPLLTTAEKWSDKYRRLPLDQLVPPPCSPHKLLQEKYASDPWKVIVICMLLNLTQGKQVRKKVKGFFKRYPDPQTAYTADPEKMAEYLAPLGLQRVKANRIQKFSKAYVGEEWTYITELCGVGKYAADAYAIFCAGRANEVLPQDHKLVDYWNYVCFELPSIQKSQDAQEAGVMGLGNVVAKVQEVAVSC